MIGRHVYFHQNNNPRPMIYHKKIACLSLFLKFQTPTTQILDELPGILTQTP